MPVYMSFITNKYCLTQWISTLLGSFEIHWGRHYLANFRGSGGQSKDNGLQGKANFYRSRALQIVPTFNFALQTLC